MDKLKALWNRVMEAVNGLKTTVTAVALILLGVAQELQAIDLKPILTMVFGEEGGGKLFIVLPLIFLALRLITSGPPRFTWKSQPKDEGF